MQTTEKRLSTSYPKDILRASYLVAFNPEKLIFYGSQAKKAFFLSSGDIDLIEPVKTKRADDLAKKLKAIVLNIERQKLCWLGDIKSGVDEEFVIDIGRISKGGLVEGFNVKRVKEFVLSKSFSEKESLLKLLSKPVTPPVFFDMQELLRKDQILRWSRDDIVKGYKEVRGQRLRLSDAIRHKTAMTKIDTIQFIGSINRFVEVTNFFFVSDSPDDFEPEKFTSELLQSIWQCYYTKKYFKLTKRLLTYFALKKDAANTALLYAIVHSKLGILYQVKSELEAIDYVCEHYDVNDVLIRSQLDALKYKLGNVSGLKGETKIDKDFDEHKLKDIIKKLESLYNAEAYATLKQSGFIPPKL